MKLTPAWLSSPEVKTLGAAFVKAGFKLRFVGGCVRDAVLGKEATELDAATNATPEQTQKLLETAGLRAIPTGIDHGTVTALVNDKSFEVTTLRKDVATDGRHATVAFGTSWEEDAKRRDFTMNALYLSLDGEMHDPVGGLEDCKAGRVVFIGDPEARIREDYLRILRYFRFAATVGNSQFDQKALKACNAGKQGIAQLSGERVATEFLKLLAAERATPALLAMKEAGILAQFMPDTPVEPVKLLDALAAPALLKLAALIGGVKEIEAVAARLKLSGKQVKLLQIWLSNVKSITPGMNELAQKKLRRAFGAEDYTNMIMLAAAFSRSIWEHYEPLTRTAAWQPPEFPIKAQDLMARGMHEGKALGDRLKALEVTWEESGYTLSRETLLDNI